MDALKLLPPLTAAGLNALIEAQMKIDTSTFILCPFQAERRLAIPDWAFKGEL
jgi:hypothetical protein